MLDILFVNSTEEAEIQQETNGTMILATKLLEADYQVDILRFCQIEDYKKDYTRFIDNAVKGILEKSPKICCFYTLWAYYHIMLRIATELKKVRGDIIVVFGGPQATITARDTLLAMDCVDYVCSGEGENTIVPFVERLLKDQKPDLFQIPGLYYRCEGEIVFNGAAPLTQLDEVPYWDDRLFTQEEWENIHNGHSLRQYFPIDAGRGCPFNCTFCCTSSVLNHSYRLKTAQRITEDIAYYNKKYGYKKFWLSHDALTTNKRLVEQICEALMKKEINIKWRCTTRIDLITEELILKMKRAGLTDIDFGLETGSPRMQKLTNKRLDVDKTKRMVSFLLKNDIRVMAYFMYGFPEETEQDLNETLETMFSMLDAGVCYVSMSMCRFFPGTKITKQYYDELEIDPKIKELKRDVFGYDEELEWFQLHKPLFVSYYHLNTPLRNQFQYVFFLAHLYQHFPMSIRHLRKIYNGNNLQFFKDFYASNKHYFEGDISCVKSAVFDNPLEVASNMVNYLGLPYGKQLIGLMKYDVNLQKVSKSKVDISIRDTYDFSYLEFAKKIPVEQYSASKTELLIQKVNGKLSVKVLRLDVVK